jgi:hypothetical protein
LKTRIQLEIGALSKQTALIFRFFLIKKNNINVSSKVQAKGSKSEAIKAAAGSDAVETKKLKAEVEELKGKLQLSAEEVSKLKSRCAAQSELLNQVLARIYIHCAHARRAFLFV